VCSEACQQINCTYIHTNALPTQPCNFVTRLTTLARTPPRLFLLSHDCLYMCDGSLPQRILREASIPCWVNLT
jgi:hypothetical protein